LLLLAACGNGRLGGGPTGTVTATGGPPGAYGFKCGSVPSINDWSAELGAVQPQARIGGTLSALLPPVAGDLKSACINAQFEARIEAIRRAGYFDKVIVRHDGNDGIRPAGQEDGFWIWTENGMLVTSYGKAMRSPLPINPQRLESWVTGLPPYFENLRKTADEGSNAVTLSSVGLSNYFGYRGVEYVTFGDLRGALVEDADRFAAKTSKVKSIGAKALVIIPLESSVIATWSASAKNIPNLNANIGLVTGTGSFVTMTGQAAAIQRSGLFRQTAIEQRDVTDPDNGDYDAVIWIRPTDTSKWYLRLKGGRTTPFKTVVGADPDLWMKAVFEAVTQARNTKP